MPKLYFKYGTMGSSKTAQALMTKFNYEEKGCKVALMKPTIDTRDGTDIIKSRIGLQATCTLIDENFDFYMFEYEDYDVIIIDESQFLKEYQVNQLKDIAVCGVPIICFGLKTDFQTHLFEGSKRLIEIADSITEVKSICKCGRKSEINARIDEQGNIVKTGEQIVLGGNDKYIGMCYECWSKS